jgi:eukaryotic-like serine/threonine-protein kinase
LSVKRFAVLLLKYGLLLAALLVTTAISAVSTMRVVLRSQEVVVPSLVGKRIPEAGPLAVRHRLLLRVEGRRHDPKVPADRVVAQEPPAGSTLKTQRSIRVWVSLGPKRITVPSVVGESARGGRLSLEQSEVPVGRVVEANDPAEEGTILMQHPPPGETETLGQEGASLLVSRGPSGRDYLMPDLIGRKAGQVLDTLRLAGLKVGEVRYRLYPGVSAGVVLRQEPAAGHRVNARTPLSLEISKEGP